MLFILLFSIGALAVPLAWDIGKRGKENILYRSGRDILAYPRIRGLLESFHFATDRLSRSAVALGSLVLIVAMGYGALRLIGGLFSLVFS